MLILDPDSVLREQDAEPDAGHLFLTREATRDQAEGLPSREPAKRRLNNGVGWIQVVRPGRADTTSDTLTSDTLTLDTELTEPQESIPIASHELAAPRGIAFGLALGACSWALIAGLIATVFF